MSSSWKYWLCLLLAAIMETAWAYALKLMQFDKLRLLTPANFYRPDPGLRILLPFTGYIIFGIANVYFFSIATRQIPLATAFTIWTGISIVLIKICDSLFLRQRVQVAEVLFILMILGGIAGLRLTAAKTQ